MPPPLAPDKSSIATTTSDNADGSTCTIHWRHSTIRSDRTAAAGNSGSDHSTTTAASFDHNIVASHRRNIADCFGRSTTAGCLVVGWRLCWMHRLS